MNYFDQLEDPRQEGKIDYPLPEVLLLLLCAVISGVDDFKNMHVYGASKIEFLRQFSPYKNGIPTGETIGNILANICPDSFQKAFIEWVKSLSNSISDIVNVDGKTLRGSFDKANKKAAIHMVSAWSSKQKLVLGQNVTEEKSNEITAIPKLLDLLQIGGAIITIDAMGCQTKIAQKIVDKKADYVLALKENQRNLYDDVTLFFEHESDVEVHIDDINKEHGRIEKRKYVFTRNVRWLKERHPHWPNLASIGYVESTRIIGSVETTDRRYYITSLYQEDSLSKFAQAVRKHWGVENKLHWVLDVTFNEDASRVRKNNLPENFSIIKRIAINLLSFDKSKKSVRSKRFMAGWNNSYLMETIMSN